MDFWLNWIKIREADEVDEIETQPAICWNCQDFQNNFSEGIIRQIGSEWATRSNSSWKRKLSPEYSEQACNYELWEISFNFSCF